MRKNKILILVEKALKVELFIFVFIALFAWFYYNFDSSHEYFNQTDESGGFSIASIIAYFATITWIISICSIFIYPFVYIFQFFILIKKKMLTGRNSKYMILLFILFFVNMIAAFSFYAITLKQNNKNYRNYRNIEEKIINKKKS